MVRALAGMSVMLGLAAATTARARAAEMRASDRPNLALSTAFFAQSPPAAAHTRTFVQQLQLESDEDSQLGLFATLGWVQESASQGDTSSSISSVSNLVLGGRYRFHGADPDFTAEVGTGLVIGLTSVDPSPGRRAARLAYGHAIAMQGVWDAFVWAPGRAGLLVPARLLRRHQFGAWSAHAVAEGALVQTLPSSDAGDSDPGRLAQLALGAFAGPVPWLSLGTRLQLVFMPTAPDFKLQSAVNPSVAVLLSRWRVEADAVVNIDEPYGWTGQGRRIWALRLQLGVRL